MLIAHNHRRRARREERRTIARDELPVLICRHLTSTGAVAALPSKEH